MQRIMAYIVGLHAMPGALSPSRKVLQTHLAQRAELQSNIIQTDFAQIARQPRVVCWCLGCGVLLVPEDTCELGVRAYPEGVHICCYMVYIYGYNHWSLTCLEQSALCLNSWLAARSVLKTFFSRQRRQSAACEQ